MQKRHCIKASKLAHAIAEEINLRKAYVRQSLLLRQSPHNGKRSSLNINAHNLAQRRETLSHQQGQETKRTTCIKERFTPLQFVDTTIERRKHVYRRIVCQRDGLSLLNEEIVLIAPQGIGGVKIQIAIALRICQEAERFQLLHKILPDIGIHLHRSKPMYHQRRRLLSPQTQQKMLRLVQVIATPLQTLL